LLLTPTFIENEALPFIETAKARKSRGSWVNCTVAAVVKPVPFTVIGYVCPAIEVSGIIGFSAAKAGVGQDGEDGGVGVLGGDGAEMKTPW
jgi:hypothetical protein